MRVLVFGTYQRDHPRNAHVRACLRRAGVEVVERHVDVWDGRRETWNAGARSLTRLAVAEARLALRGAADADVVLVGYPGHPDLRAARRAARGRPVVFDPLLSLHDTLVGDRARFAPRSPAARVLDAIDRSAFRAADLVVADTEAHARFYAARFGLPASRLRVCFVGAEDRLFRPGKRREGGFHALFVGKLIPLHGLDTILAAARHAPEICFRIVGSGQLRELLERAPPNVRHVAWIDYERLPEAYRRAGCALGVFARAEKTARVIPSKAFQALACGTPLVTADSPAARELLTSGEDALLVPPADPPALADAVRTLAADASLARRLGRAGHETYLARASEEALGRRWSALLGELVDAA